MKASDDHDSQPSDRRRYPRAEVAWRIVLEHEGGFQWRGETVALEMPWWSSVTSAAKSSSAAQLADSPTRSPVPLRGSGRIPFS